MIRRGARGTNPDGDLLVEISFHPPSSDRQVPCKPGERDNRWRPQKGSNLGRCNEVVDVGGATRTGEGGRSLGNDLKRILVLFKPPGNNIWVLVKVGPQEKTSPFGGHIVANLLQ